MGIPAPIGVGASGLPPANDQANAVVSGILTAIGSGKPFAFRGPMNLAVWASINTTLTTTAGSFTASVASATGLGVGNSISSKNLPGGATVGVLSGTTVTLAPPIISLQAVFNGALGQITLPSGYPTAALVGATVTSDSSLVVIPGSTTVASVTQASVAPQGNNMGTPGIVQLSAAPTLVPAVVTPIPLEFALGVASILVSGADAAAKFTGPAIVFVGTVQIERSFDGGQTWLVCNVGGSGQLAQYTTGTPLNITFGEPEKQVLYRINCIAYTSGTINYRISQTGGAAESLAIGPLSGG